MDILSSIDQGRIYFVDHNGEPNFGYIRLYANGQAVMAYDFDKVWDLSGWEVGQDGAEIAFTNGGSSYTIRPIQLDDAKTVFPNIIRTFRDVESLQNFAKKALSMSDSYAVNTDPDETISFTVDDDGTVLELIRVTDEGDMYARNNGGWILLQGEDHPTIMDRDLVDVDPDDIPEAIKTWDDASDSGSTLMESDILPLASAQQ